MYSCSGYLMRNDNKTNNQQFTRGLIIGIFSMIYIKHRINTIEELQAVPTHYGIEMDIRSYGKDLVVTHEPFTPAVLFDDWLKSFKHKTLILNVKEEGLETAVLALMKKYGIEDYFFLDQSFPFLVKTANTGENRCAVRVSEFESIDTALSLAGKIKWVWVDCFTKFPLSKEDEIKLHNAGFNLCIVSPELEAHDPIEGIKKLKALFKEQNLQYEAVCTKRPDLWEAKD